MATRGVLQMLKFGAHLMAPISVEGFIPGADVSEPHQLKLDCGATVKAYSVLVATGVTWRKLTAPGADRYEAVGYSLCCTIVEANLHEGRDVAVVGGGNSAGPSGDVFG